MALTLGTDFGVAKDPFDGAPASTETMALDGGDPFDAAPATKETIAAPEL